MAQHRRSDENAKKLVRRLEEREFADEDGDEYRASEFGGVKEYKARKRLKQHHTTTHLQQHTAPVENPTLFRNLVIHVTGHTVPSARELHALVAAHGGAFVQHLDGRAGATHIVAENLARGKMVELAGYRVVRPQWVLDCVAAGRVRPWTEYRVVGGEGRGQGRLAWGGGSAAAEAAAEERPLSPLARDAVIPASDEEDAASSQGLSTNPLSTNPTPGDPTPAQPLPQPPPQPPPSPPAPVAHANGQPLWAADCIIGTRTHRRQTHYWIRWTGFPDDEATWEGARALARDIGREGLAELVAAWRERPWRRVGAAWVLREVERPVLERRFGAGVVSRAFDGEAVDGEDEAPPGGQKGEGIATDGPTPPPGQKEKPESTPPTVVSGPPPAPISAAAGNDQKPTPEKKAPGSPVDFRKEETASFTFGTPVDFAGVLTRADPDPDGDVQMSQAELLTPREELEAYNARGYEDLEPLPGMGSPERQLSPVQRSGLDIPISPPPLAARDKDAEPSSELMAAFLSKPGIRSQTVLDPGFLQSYFSHSRLHHLSTWKSKIRADLHPHILTLTPKKDRSRRYVLHADLDAFFASASLLSRPDLKNSPVAIAHGTSSSSSEIAACNYPARAFGIKAGMWLDRAKELCPPLVVLGYDFPVYERASREFYRAVVAVGAERIHAGSVDEALLDISNLVCDVGLGTVQAEEEHAVQIAQQLRESVRAATGGLEVSVGVGGNMLLARLALRKAKPAGVYMVKAAEVDGFLDGIEVAEMPGVGPKVVARVEEAFGTGSVKVLRGVRRDRLTRVLGKKMGVMLWKCCGGVDESVVGEVAVRRSLSVDVNWGVRFETTQQAEAFISQLSAEVSTRLTSENLLGGHVTLTIKQRSPDAPFQPAKHLGHGECTTSSHGVLLPEPTTKASRIARVAAGILRAMKVPAWELRGIGITMARLKTAGAGAAGGGQDVLRFAKVEGGRETDGGENVPPWDRPLPKPYVRPKPASLLDSFLKKPAAPAPARTAPEPEQEAEAEVEAVSSTQFEIPDDVDEAVIPFLPQSLQERIRAHQRRAGKAPARVPDQPQAEEEEEEEEDLSQPPNSQDDVTVWRALPHDIRALLRSEHAAATRARSPPKEREKEKKRQTLLPHSPRKLPRLPWEPISPRKSHPRTNPTTPTKPKRARPPPPPSEAGPSTHRDAPILDARGNDVSSWLFTLGGIDRSYFHAVPASDQRAIVAAAARQHGPRLAAAAARARREAAEAAKLAGALRLVERGWTRRLADGTRVGSLPEVKAFVGRVWAARDVGGVRVLGGLLQERWAEGAVAEVQEVGRLVGVLVQEGSREEGEWRGAVEAVVDMLRAWGGV